MNPPRRFGGKTSDNADGTHGTGNTTARRSKMATWNMEVNLAGVAARAPGGTFVEPATGAYKVKITATEAYEKDGKSSVKFQTVIDGGDFAGTEVRLFLGADLSKMGNQRSWKTALLSAGFNAGQIEAGNVQIGEKTFDGKTAYIYYKAKDPNDPTSQANREFITSESFTSLTGGNAGSISSGATQASAAPKPAAGSKLRNMMIGG